MIMKHLKIKIMSIAFMAVATSSMAQSLNKMNWLNEPQQWEIKDGKTLVMDVPAKTDFWRISHYGFTVDDGPFYYATYGGEFEAINFCTSIRIFSCSANNRISSSVGGKFLLSASKIDR